MKTSTWALLILAGAILYGCSGNHSVKDTKEQVIALHDTIMGKNDQLVHLEMRIDSMLRDMDSVKKVYTNADTVLLKNELNAIQSRLKGSEERMNDWMYKFEPDVTGKSDEEALKYFEGEKNTLSNLQQEFIKNISEADNYIKNLK